MSDSGIFRNNMDLERIAIIFIYIYRLIQLYTGKYTKRYGGNLIFPAKRQVVTDAVGKIIDDVGKAFDSVGNIVEDVGNSLHQQINKMT